VDELDAIYRYEMAPVVHGNLKVVAGEWAGFGHAWLREHVGGYVAAAREAHALVGRHPPGPPVDDGGNGAGLAESRPQDR
jgi:hypothetical protein